MRINLVESHVTMDGITRLITHFVYPDAQPIELFAEDKGTHYIVSDRGRTLNFVNDILLDVDPEMEDQIQLSALECDCQIGSSSERELYVELRKDALDETSEYYPTTCLFICSLINACIKIAALPNVKL